MCKSATPTRREKKGEGGQKVDSPLSSLVWRVKGKLSQIRSRGKGELGQDAAAWCSVHIIITHSTIGIRVPSSES